MLEMRLRRKTKVIVHSKKHSSSSHPYVLTEMMKYKKMDKPVCAATTHNDEFDSRK